MPIFLHLSYWSLLVITAGCFVASAAAFDPVGLALYTICALALWFLATSLGCLVTAQNGWLPAGGRRRLALFFCLAVNLSVIGTQWPLRLAFRISRPSLNAVVQRIEAGDAIYRPEWVGLFRVREAGIHRTGKVYLWTDPDPSGPGGLVHCSPAEIKAGFNLWFNLRLDDQWQLVFED